MHVHADLDWVLELQQRREPAGRDGTRVADDCQHAGVLILQTHVVACHLDRRRRKKIGQSTCSAGEAALLARQRLLRAVCLPALLKTQTEHAVLTPSPVLAVRRARPGSYSRPVAGETVARGRVRATSRRGTAAPAPGRPDAARSARIVR